MRAKTCSSVPSPQYQTTPSSTLNSRRASRSHRPEWKHHLRVTLPLPSTRHADRHKRRSRRRLTEFQTPSLLPCQIIATTSRSTGTVQRPRSPSTTVPRRRLSRHERIALAIRNARPSLRRCQDRARSQRRSQPSRFCRAPTVQSLTSRVSRPAVQVR